MQSAGQKIVIAGVLLLNMVFANLQASPQQDVDKLLAATEAPVGVVFEVVTGSGDNLDAILTQIHDWTKSLKKRFESLPVVVISHGQEQFSLTSDVLAKNTALQQALTTIRSDDVPVMVCGNHASLRGVDTASYPQEIDVVKTAPATVRELRARRYAVIIVSA